VEGADLSSALLAQYRGPARTHRGDCRHLPFPEQCRDAAIVQGGLHHLSTLPDDLDQVFMEIQRVLRKNGRVVFVEPWLTPFLKLVHWVAARPVARRCSTKLDAFQTMFEHERRTYEQWLTQPDLILTLARARFSTIHESFAWGKRNFVGTPR
jgi:ubiquinone/menaquinone biosynthesis C-methylase UbiE